MDSSLLSDATSSDDSPTPGYQLSEIARKKFNFYTILYCDILSRICLHQKTGATIASYQACTQLEDFLLSRITKSNHNIKYKCLQIIKVLVYSYSNVYNRLLPNSTFQLSLLKLQHVCRSGRPEFKRDMGRNTGPIKECLRKLTSGYLLMEYPL